MANYVFGVDIGGTTVKIGLFTIQGEMVNIRNMTFSCHILQWESWLS